MNRISKKLLLCALVINGIVTSYINAARDPQSRQAVENMNGKYIDHTAMVPAAEAAEVDEAIAMVEADKVADEADEVDAAIAMVEADKSESTVTQRARGRRSGRRKRSTRKASAKSKKAKKSTRKRKEGSKFEKKRVTRKRSVHKAKSTRKSKTARPRRQPKGVAQRADNKGRVKSWQSRHKRTQSFRKKRLSKTPPKTSSAQRAAMARNRAKNMLAKQPWTLKQQESARRLRARLTKQLPRPYTQEDAELMERLNGSIEGRTITDSSTTAIEVE